MASHLSMLMAHLEQFIRAFWYSRLIMKNSTGLMNWSWYEIYIFFRCFMVVIRGVGCYCPCPVCLIPREKQADFSVTAKLRSVKKTKKLLGMAKEKTQTEMEKLLKAKGLRNIEVCSFCCFIFYLLTYFNECKTHFLIFSTQTPTRWSLWTDYTRIA